MREGDALGQSPIGFLGVAAPQGLRKRGCSGKRASDNDDAGRVAIEAVHELRPLPLVALKAIKQAIDMASDPGAPWLGIPLGLFSTKSDVVLVDDKALDERLVRVATCPGGPRLFRGRADAVDLRRKPDRLPRFEPVAGLGAFSVDAHLTRAQQFLQMPVRRARDSDA